MKKYIYFAVAALVMTFAACSSSNDDGPTPTPTPVNPNQPVEVSLVKAPDFALSSNGKQIAGTVATRAGHEEAKPVDVLANILYNRSNVETNLSMLTYTSGEGTAAASTYYASKLSVHLRAVTNATVTIPVPTSFWAKVRNSENWEANLTNEEVATALKKMDSKYTADVNGDVVTFTVAYSTNEITVTISGMTTELLKHCKDTYGDGEVNCGMTFEVWNYYDKQTELQAALNQSTITFTTAPDAYINSFGKLYDFDTKEYTTINTNDCTVLATGENVADFTKKTTKLELQNSFYDLYTTATLYDAIKSAIDAANGWPETTE